MTQGFRALAQTDDMNSLTSVHMAAYNKLLVTQGTQFPLQTSMVLSQASMNQCAFGSHAMAEGCRLQSSRLASLLK